MIRPTAAFVLAAALCLPAAGAEDVVLQLPEDFRTALDNYSISDRLGQEDQVISLYANALARDAVRAGEPLPDGAIIVGEIYKARKDASGEVVETTLGRRIPDSLAAIVMMERRAEWAEQYPDDLKLGGWEFEVFSSEGENLAKDTAACRECHAPLAEQQFLFSFQHLGGAN